MKKITSLEEFQENINARGPDSGIPFEDIVGEVMELEVLLEWKAYLGGQAMLIAAEEVLGDLEEQFERLEEQGLFDADDDDEANGKKSAIAAALTMKMAVDRAITAAFAAGLFTGQAMSGDGLRKSEIKDGWGDNIWGDSTPEE